MYLKYLFFLILQGPELMNKYVGESERAVREVRKCKLYMMFAFLGIQFFSVFIRLSLNFPKNLLV